MSKHLEIEGEISERVVKGCSVTGALASAMNGRSVPMELKRSLRNRSLLPALTSGLENRTWNRVQESRICTVEISYLSGACGVTRWDRESNEGMCEMWHGSICKWSEVWMVE